MFGPNLINLANDVAQSSLLPGTKLKAVAGTALDALVQNAMPSESLIASQECLEHSLGSVIDKCYTEFGFTEGAAIYQAYDAIEEQCINPLKNQLSFTRNTVSPIIREVVTDVNERLSVRVDPFSQFKINQIEVPSFVYETVLPRIQNLMSLYNPGQKGPSTQPTFENPENNLLVELIRTEDDATNEGIMSLSEVYTKQFGGDLFQDAWALLKQPNHTINDAAGTYRNFILYLTALLAVEKLEKEPIRGLQISEADLKTWCLFFKVACTRVVFAFANMYSGAVSAKTMISSVAVETKTINVFYDVYAAFEVPNKADILVGILNSGNPMSYRQLDVITENAEDLARRGQLILTTANAIDNTRRAARTFDAIVSSVLTLIDNTKNDEHAELKAFIEDKPTLEYRGIISKYLNAYYPGTRILETELPIVVSDVVCELFFKDTMASLILKHLIQAENAKADLDTTTVVSTAIINILIEWVAGQIEIVKE